MTKREQLEINATVEESLDIYKDIIQANPVILRRDRLRTCSAYVQDLDCGYYVLVSYGTVIAFIDKYDNTLYDFLRYVYGYTATSAQHISKFAKDYNASKRLTWKRV